MKLITYLFTILMTVGFYTALQGDCADGHVTCKDGTEHSWPCIYKFPACEARDYPSSLDAAKALCAAHGGVEEYSFCFLL